MADIRINALATTATTPASDDYLALDGTAQGTRKILATNIANNVTDVILGSSGPSVKSTLSARAPRQGLVFDGTGTGATVTNVPAFGTGDFTFAAWVNQSSLAGAYLCSATAGPDNCFMYLVGDGTFQWWSNAVARATSSAGTIVAGKWNLLVASRTGGNVTLYSNGVSVGSGLDSQSITSAIDRIGLRANTNASILNGAIAPLIYNRALSSSEVVALYEAGAPARYDYNPSTNAAVPSGGTYAKWFGTGTVSSGTASSFTVDAGASSLYVRNINRYSTAVIGAQYKIDLTITGTITGIVGFEGVGNGTSVALAGTGSYVITGTAAGAVNPVFECTSVAGGTITITGITALGLLLAPDAYQAGGGLSWYDTSGNSATISWTSGVTWNVPTSGYWGGQLKLQNTTGTNGLRINNISSDTFAFLGGGNDGLPIFSSLNNATIGSATYGWLAFNSSATGDFELYRRNNSTTNTAALIVTRGSGNLLLGTTTDDALGKLQVTGAITLTGFIYQLENQAIRWRSSGGTTRADIYADNTGVLNLRTGATPSSALTLDGSQNATFAGNVLAGGGSSSFRICANTASGDDRDIFAAQIAGASNGFQIKWNHATTTTRIIIANLPTSSSGLAAGTLWNDSGTIKIA